MSSTISVLIKATNDASADEILNGTAGDDTLVGTAADDTIFGFAGHDSLSGGAGSDHIEGDTGNDTISGGDDADWLSGGDGDDVIDGGAGNDEMQGGQGNDTYNVDSEMDVVTELAGEGTDTVIATSAYTLSDHLENLSLQGSADYGTGNALDNRIIGNTERNRLEGGGGNDYLDGGNNIDYMRGGDGNDIYIVNSSQDDVDEAGGGGVDTVRTTANYVLRDFVENLEIVSGSRSGTGNDLNNLITGSGGDNTLLGMAGNDTINGGGGSDAMDGGEGDDTFVVSQSGDTVTEADEPGIDTVLASVSFTLGNNIENLTLTGSGNLNAAGNELDNILTANSGNNELSGGTGNDVYRFGPTNGSDRIFDTGGTDRIEFAGIASADITVTRNDTSIFLAISGGRGTIALENFFLGADSEIEAIQFSNETWDRAALLSQLEDNESPRLEIPIADQFVTEDASFSFTLPAGTFVDPEGAVLTLTFTRADGTAVPSWLNFNSTTRTFSGTPPNTAAPSNDAGHLQIRVTATDPLQGSVSDVFVLQVANHIQGNASANTLTGTAIRDVIEGGGANDTIDGGGGDDHLVGGSGSDRMTGGAGNDTFVTNSASDTVVEAAGQGSDTVQTNFNYTLLTNFENLTLYGTGNFNATGNTVANILTGNSGHNILDGLGGVDTMIGGDGNDTYKADKTGDVVNEVGAGGNDRVDAMETYTLNNTAANVEDLTLLGSLAINGTGNSLDNTIKGNGAANTLTGLDGNDTLDGLGGGDSMVGGAGNDRYRIDTTGSSGDRVTEAAGLGVGGFDWIESTLALDLTNANYGTNVEGLVITSTVAMNATGNDLNNLLRGNSQSNILTGGAGHDMLESSGGADTLHAGIGNAYLHGGAGADTLNGTDPVGKELFIGGTGNDTINTGGGVDIIAFNQGDQADAVYSDNGRDNILSLGRGIEYSELYFVRTSSGHLILRTINGTDTTEQITFRDWFSTDARQSVGTLQVVAEWMTGFNANGTDVLRNDRIEQFDFLALANEFAADTTTPIGTAWRITEERLRDARFIETGSDTAALGGDLAYQYGMSAGGSLSNVGAVYAQSLLGDAFGTQMQLLQTDLAILGNGPALL